jgi:hypothetical protein
VCGHDDHGAGVGVGQFLQRHADPLAEVVEALQVAAGRRVTAAPGRELDRVAHGDLGQRHALPHAEVALPQPRVGGHRQAGQPTEAKRGVEGA